MFYAIYSTATGALVSTGTVVADPLPADMALVACGDVHPTGNWNPATLVFDPVPVERMPLAPLEFMRRFTVQEEAAIRTAARTDTMVEVFLARLNAAQVVHLDAAETIGGVNYCISKDCITTARGTEILNG